MRELPPWTVRAVTAANASFEVGPINARRYASAVACGLLAEDQATRTEIRRRAAGVWRVAAAFGGPAVPEPSRLALRVSFAPLAAAAFERADRTGEPAGTG